MKISELYAFMNEHGGAKAFMRYWEVADECEDIQFGAEDSEVSADDMEHYIQEGEPSPVMNPAESKEGVQDGYLVQVENIEMPPVVEYSNQPVVTTEQLAEFYGCEPKQIRQNFNNNKERFVEGKHYFKLDGEQLRVFRTASKISTRLELEPEPQH